MSAPSNFNIYWKIAIIYLILDVLSSLKFINIFSAWINILKFIYESQLDIRLNIRVSN